ncbi:hypothetical protein QE152_g14456 [Popillia japonica]|uniref:Transposable element P transposase-like GTP-binding insertion domain-containing protein n=1 Tax=Popillia japonica TaxID=7064 RepID=A0AAW1L752_POPJA
MICPISLKLYEITNKTNVKFTWKEGEQTARWDDIVKMYELDVGDFDTRVLNKLTDQHVYADKIKVMKVKLVSQVFSQRVSSVMRGLVRLVPEEDDISSVDILDDEEPPYYTLSQTSDPMVINRHAYIAGYMARRILKSIGSCKTCRTSLVSTKNTEQHILIECRTYSAKALVRPETGFISLFDENQKETILLHLLGEDTYETYMSVLEHSPVDPLTSAYELAKQRLNYLPKKLGRNVLHAKKSDKVMKLGFIALHATSSNPKEKSFGNKSGKHGGQMIGPNRLVQYS